MKFLVVFLHIEVNKTFDDIQTKKKRKLVLFTHELLDILDEECLNHLVLVRV